MAGYNLKDSEEVKEYLKNLHTEYQFGCMSEKRPEVCHLLGDYYEAIKTDRKEAAKVYKQNCDDYNFGRSCTKYGDYLVLDKDLKAGPKEAFKYYQKACDNNDPKGCCHAGVVAVSEENLESNKEKQVFRGIEFLRKACDSGYEKACFYLSGVFLKGVEGILEKNFKEAYVLSLKCCELGNPYACANVSVMHKNGDGVQQNLEMAKSFRIRAQGLYQEITKEKAQLKFHRGID